MVKFNEQWPRPDDVETCPDLLTLLDTRLQEQLNKCEEQLDVVEDLIRFHTQINLSHKDRLRRQVSLSVLLELHRLKQEIADEKEQLEQAINS